MCLSSELRMVIDRGSQSAALIPLSFNGLSFHTVSVRVPPHIPLQIHIAPNVIFQSVCVSPRKSMHLKKDRIKWLS